jgi:hypothetical protein
LPNSTEVGFTKRDWPGTNGTVTAQQGGGGIDGAVEEEHAARQKPKTNAVKSRITIRSFLRPTRGFRIIDLASY